MFNIEAGQALTQGRIDDAEGLCAELLAADDMDLSAIEAMAGIRLRQGRISDAESLLTSALEKALAGVSRL